MSELTLQPGFVIDHAAAERAIARCEALLQAHYARLAARKREPFRPSLATASPSRDALYHPLDRAVVGDSST